MNRNQVYNFSAGPSVMPEDVLRQAQAELLNYKGTGMSVMEMSHRSPAFQEIFDDAKATLKRLLNVPDSHEILFLQGGATMQFSMVPLNLMSRTGKADYAVTGNFANGAAKEAAKYGTVRRVWDTTPDYTTIPSRNELTVNPDASYFYYCANSTIYGTQWQYIPEVGEVPLVCDMSSDFLSRPVDVSKFGIIFAGAQKNAAPAGLTIAIVRRDLMGHALPITPLMLDYRIQIDKDSMYNTPPCWCIYMLGLQCHWIEAQGGVEEMQRRAMARSSKLYAYLDSSTTFRAKAAPTARSLMNVTFTTDDPAKDAAFVKLCESKGLKHIKGHRISGGMRASIYNAMPMEGVDALIETMKEFEQL